MELYLSDLDGTLLNEGGTLSAFSTAVLTRLMNNGLHFTVATGRTPLSVFPKLSAIPLQEPLVLMNGAALVRSEGEVLWTVPLEEEAMARLGALENRFGVRGALLREEDKRIVLSFASALTPLWQRFFLRNEAERPDGKDCRSAAGLPSALYGIYAADTPEPLASMAAVLAKDGSFTIDFYKDSYDDACWCLEVYSSAASKGRAAAELRRRSGATRLIAFGDGSNDLSLFAVCEEGYAVENACPALRQIATGIIGRHWDDGVARFLAERTGKAHE